MRTLEQNRQKERVNKQNFYDAHRSQGLCLECVNPVAEGKARCEACLTRRRAKRKERLTQATETGKCGSCCTLEAIQGNRLCVKCYLRSISVSHFGTTRLWEQLLHKFNEQNSRCALSGFPLTLGVDAELDPILPKGIGGSELIANTQWVLHVVNRMKDKLLEDDFFGLIEGLYQTMKANRE